MPAAGSDSPQERRDEVLRRRAAVAAEVDALEASDADVAEAMATLQAALDARRADAAAARQAADVAVARQERSRTAEAAVAARLRVLRRQLRDLAIDTFMAGPQTHPGTLLDASSIADATRRDALSRFTTRTHDDVVGELAAAEEDLAARRAAASRAAETASERLEAAEARLAEVEAAHDEQRELAQSVQTRLDRTLSEAAALASLDAELAAEIAEREQALARQVPPVAGGGSDGSAASVPTTSVGTTSVRGIEVSVEIADELEALLAAAEADGIVLGGGGYRDPQQQVETRRRNCGTSHYALHEMPASSCSPPTARPGRSMHEQGLAVDFTYNGAIIPSQSSPAFRWLDANAHRYGLKNLPSEPWHWSTNGN